MKMPIDIITVVFQEELGILKSQAQSINQYCKNVGKIIVIINDDNLSILDIDVSWWGSLKDKVFIIHRSYWSAEYSGDGWVSQQALKLAASSVAKNQYSLILDAKTIFVQDIYHEKLFTDQNKSKLGQIEINPVFNPSRMIVQSLFDIELDMQLGPGGVPFIVDNNAVRKMIQWIESKVNGNFISWFQDQGMLTEFILYSGWVVKCHDTLDYVTEKTNTFGKIFNIIHDEVPVFTLKFRDIEDATTVSIHRDAWKLLDGQQQDQYRKFLAKKKITMYTI